jgi:hypothetical protein
MINISKDEESPRVIDSIVLGFSADPVLRWLFPESQKYLEVLLSTIPHTTSRITLVPHSGCHLMCIRTKKV